MPPAAARSRMAAEVGLVALEPEGHGAEAEARDGEPGAAEAHVVHGLRPDSRRRGRRPPGRAPRCGCSRRDWCRAGSRQSPAFIERFPLVHHRVDLPGQDDGVVDGGRLVHAGMPRARLVHGAAGVHDLEELLAVELAGGGLIGRELHHPEDAAAARRLQGDGRPGGGVGRARVVRRRARGHPEIGQAERGIIDQRERVRRRRVADDHRLPLGVVARDDAADLPEHALLRGSGWLPRLRPELRLRRRRSLAYAGWPWPTSERPGRRLASARPGAFTSAGPKPPHDVRHVRWRPRDAPHPAPKAAVLGDRARPLVERRPLGLVLRRVLPLPGRNWIASRQPHCIR